MTMSDNWQKAYEELQGYISRNSDVVIDAGAVSIAEDFRADFYRLFDTVRTLAMKKRFPDLIKKSESLSRQYVKAEKAVVETCGIKSVVMDTGLDKFLHDPTSGLIRGLFDPLYDLLKGKITTEEFESGLSENIKDAFDQFYRIGYEKWIQLSLVKSLEANSFFEIVLRKPGSKEIIKRTPSLEKVPAPLKTKRLSFKHDPAPIFVVPDFIFRSGKKDCYVAIRSGLTGALRNASNASGKREWNPITSISGLFPGLILIYADQSPEEVSLVADMAQICRPDILLFCREKENRFEKNEIDKFKQIANCFKPRLGFYVISRNSIPQNSEIENIRFLSVGFDQIRLSDIVDVL